MRFWGKNKYGEKKNSREKLSFGESLEEDYGETGLLLGEEGKIPGQNAFVSETRFFHFIHSLEDCMYHHLNHLYLTLKFYSFQVRKTYPAVLI